MKKLFIVANWKSHKTTEEATEWLTHMAEGREQRAESEKHKDVIVCASFTLLPAMKAFITKHNLPIKLGAQDVSPFEAGAYTGEVNAEQLKHFVEYVIIGHSERRNYFGETDEMLSKKVQRAKLSKLTPIFCVQGKETPIPEEVTVVAYEPVEAIGSGHPDTPEDADEVAKTIKKQHPTVQYVLYGGSVTAENVKNFTKMSSIDGVLVGGASLDAAHFDQIIEKA